MKKLISLLLSIIVEMIAYPSIIMVKYCLNHSCTM